MGTDPVVDSVVGSGDFERGAAAGLALEQAGYDEAEAPVHHADGRVRSDQTGDIVAGTRRRGACGPRRQFTSY